MSQPVDEIPPEELGVERGMAREYLLKVHHAREFSERTFAVLDGYADGELADAPTAHLRDAQIHLREAVDLLESEAGVVESRVEAIEQRMEEEGVGV